MQNILGKLNTSCQISENTETNCAYICAIQEYVSSCVLFIYGVWHLHWDQAVYCAIPTAILVTGRDQRLHDNHSLKLEPVYLLAWLISSARSITSFLNHLTWIKVIPSSALLDSNSAASRVFETAETSSSWWSI